MATRAEHCVALGESKRTDLTGVRFGLLTAQEDVGKRGNSNRQWRCVCDCGTVCVVPTDKLRMGRKTSCGCNHGNPLDLTGQRFGYLTALNRAVSKRVSARVTRSRWLCRCDCGKSVEVATDSLRTGESNSCGCKAQDLRTAILTKHGGSTNNRKSAEYRTWGGMKARCYTPNSPGFLAYGGRGITVCEAWRNSFLVFRRDVGPRPSPRHSLDRINVNGNYEPGNVRWATPMEQAQNTRSNVNLTVGGETHCTAEWERRGGLHPGTIRRRLSLNWPVDRAVLTPSHPTKGPARRPATKPADSFPPDPDANWLW